MRAGAEPRRFIDENCHMLRDARRSPLGEMYAALASAGLRLRVDDSDCGMACARTSWLSLKAARRSEAESDGNLLE